MSEKKFPGTTVTGMFAGKGFVIAQTNIDAQTYDKFAKLMEEMKIGGQLRFKKGPEGGKVMGFIEYLSPEEAATEKKRYEDWKAKNPRASL